MDTSGTRDKHLMYGINPYYYKTSAATVIPAGKYLLETSAMVSDILLTKQMIIMLPIPLTLGFSVEPLGP